MRRLKLLKLLSWYKELQLEKSKIQIYHARIVLEKFQKEKEILEAEYRDCMDYLEKKKSFPAHELRAWINYFEALKDFRDIAEKKIETQQKYLKELKEELLEKNREKRLMERLYEKTILKVNRENLRRFLKELDDLVLLRRGRGLD